MVRGEQSRQGIQSHRRHADEVRVENIPRIHDVGHHRRDYSGVDEKVYSVNLSISTAESSSCRYLMTLHGEKNRKCVQNPIKVSKYARRFPCGRWSFWEPGSEKRWCEICSNEPVGNWTELQEWWYSKWIQNPVTNISCIQCLWERGFRKQRTWQEVYPIQRKWRKHRAASLHGDFSKSDQHHRSHSRSVQRIERIFSWWLIRRFWKLGKIWYTRTKWDGKYIPRIYYALKCKTLAWRKHDNLWDRYVQNINDVNDKISNSKEKTSITLSIEKLDGGTTESHGEARRHRLHLQLRRSRTSQRQTSWSLWCSTSSDKWCWFRFLGRNSRKSTGGYGQDTHSQYTSVQYRFITSADRTHNALGSRIALSSWCAWQECSYLVFSMSHPWLSHLPLTTSTSTSSFALLSRTQKQHHRYNQNNSENTQYITHIPSVDKLRHQESLWREDVQSGGNPRTTTSTNYRDLFESRISAEAKEKLLTRASGKLDAETRSSWSYDMEGHAK